MTGSPSPGDGWTGAAAGGWTEPDWLLQETRIMHLLFTSAARQVNMNQMILIFLFFFFFEKEIYILIIVGMNYLTFIIYMKNSI